MSSSLKASARRAFRHLIGPQTLAAAVKRSRDRIQDMRRFVVIFAPVDERILASDAIQSEACRILQTHRGNIWRGKPGESSAMGFFTEGVYRWLEYLVETGLPMGEGFVSSSALVYDTLFALESYDFAQEYSPGLLTSVERAIYNARTDTEFIDVGRLSSAVKEIVSGCEFDLPPDGSIELQTLGLELFESFRFSSYIFTDGTACRFMEELKAPRPPAQTPVFPDSYPEQHGLHL